MSDEDLAVPETSDEFPAPISFVLTPVKDGAYHKGLATITAVYLNCDAWPDGKFLMGMTGVTLDPHDTDPTKMLMHLFIQPESDEIPEEGGAEIFSDTCGFELAAEQTMVDDFFSDVRKVKAFTLAISTEEYYFTCRVDSESTMVTDVKCDWRYLH